MSRKSVVIALPQRSVAGASGEPGGADTWVHAVAAREALPPRGSGQSPAIIDLDEARSPMELAWLLWTFPVRAVLRWMANSLK
jgi:hypothetical protein